MLFFITILYYLILNRDIHILILHILTIKCFEIYVYSLNFYLIWDEECVPCFSVVINSNSQGNCGVGGVLVFVIIVAAKSDWSWVSGATFMVTEAAGL